MKTQTERRILILKELLKYEIRPELVNSYEAELKRLEALCQTEAILATEI